MDTTQKSREEAQRRQPSAGAAGQAKAERPPRQTPSGQRPTAQNSRQKPMTQPAKRRPASKAPDGSGQAVQKGTRRPADGPSGAPGKPARGQALPAPNRAKRPAGAAVKERKTGDAAQRRKQARRSAEQTDLSSGKKRAYGNSKPKKKSALQTLTESVKSAAANSKARARARQEAKPRSARRQPTPAVIYTEPKKFNRSRLLMQLLIVGAVVAALVLGVSVFFKVEEFTVTGANVYTAWSVREASGISEGDSLLFFSRPRAGAQIKANLPYVKNVRFGIKLPDTVNIIIEEEDVVYAIKDTAGTWWLVSSKGRVVQQAGSRASNYTQITGITLENPTPNTQAVAMEEKPAATDETGVVQPVTTSGAQRLKVALEIVTALENNDIVGEAASVDVSHLEEITLWYGTRYQVDLGDATQIEYKIACMNDVILQLSEYQSGILDVSFTIWPDKVVYTPFG